MRVWHFDPDRWAPSPCRPSTSLITSISATQPPRTGNHPEATGKALAARRAELAQSDGSAYVFLALVAHADEQHAGWNLVEALKQKSKEMHASAVLFPATDRLVGHYTRLGAVIDGDAGRRMVFDYRQNS